MSNKSVLDPVIEAYIGRDWELSQIINARPGRRSPILEALCLLREFIIGHHSASGAIAAARRIDVKGYDNDLCILFLGNWAHASYLQSSFMPEKLTEAWALLNRARALLSGKTPSELGAYLDLVESFLVGATGNHEVQEKILRAAFKKLKADSPRRKFIVLELASFLASSGRLAEIESELNKAAVYSDNFKKSWITAVRFINYIESGDTTRASALLPELSRALPETQPLRNIQKYSILMDIISSRPSGPGPGGDASVTAQIDSPDWAMVINCLLYNRIHQALRWARICEKKNQTYIAGQEFISFNLLRAELAEGNTEAARRITEMRMEHGNRHYLDEFFMARICLLENDQDSANDYFASALKSIEKYNAQGRLDFELKISTEMPRDVVFNIARTAEKVLSGPAARQARVSAHPVAQQRHTVDSTGTDRIISSTPVMEQIKDSIRQFSGVDVPILITGETGTGKELVAKALHETGPRAQKPFMAINCGAISESLLESELFGHEKGAFSGAASAHKGLFEEAKDGTIFLDEIGEITPRLQIVLLRVLETNEIRPVGSSQSRKISCRIIASTNADLQALEKENRFRKDLIYRLRRLEIHLPPLRERADDILMLATHFLNTGRPQDVYATMSAGLAQKLVAYGWPGNVRELRNNIERMRLMNSDKLYYDAIDIDLTGDEPNLAAATTPVHPLAVSPDPQPVAGSGFKAGKSRVRRMENIRNLFREHDILTRNEIVRTLEVSPNTVTKDLQALCEEDFIEKEQPTASPRSAYFKLKT